MAVQRTRKRTQSVAVQTDPTRLSLWQYKGRSLWQYKQTQHDLVCGSTKDAVCGSTKDAVCGNTNRLNRSSVVYSVIPEPEMFIPRSSTVTSTKRKPGFWVCWRCPYSCTYAWTCFIFYPFLDGGRKMLADGFSFPVFVFCFFNLQLNFEQIWSVVAYVY